MDDYAPPPGYFDELRSAPEGTQAHWKRVIDGLKEIGQENLLRRVEQQRRLVQDNGITYNVYSDPAQASRPWSMDIVPMLVADAEWRELELALGQRLHLLNLILQDCYGRQNLLRGPYPPELVLGNPAFLRACKGVIPPRRRFLHLYTVDLARAPDGSWWVLSDRLDAASGLGYALENRFISSRVLPDVLRPLGVRRVQPHIQHYCSAIERLAPRQQENPLIVLLTPGPFNETYFEQSFLARQLGYPLVEGADLTVRDNRVYLKTIDGMRQVDVILRRLDSDFCDPLELRDDSLLGVPGLINAIRQGNVAVTNVPGSSLLETPALLAFLPGMCRNLLGEDLRLPSVATWWCGQSRERQYVLANLERLVIKPTFRTRENRHSVFGPRLSKEERERLAKRIEAEPESWTAQEIVSQATAPVFEDGRLQPRHFLLRCFMVLGADGHGHLMPGGLGRAARGASVEEADSSESKDVWVVGSLPDAKAEAAVELQSRPAIRRASENLPSRVADNLFWLGRYVERTEAQVRGLLVILRAVQEGTSDEETASLTPFIAGLLTNDTFAELVEITENEPPRKFVEAVLERLVWDLDYPMGLSANLGHVNRTTYTVKERISGNTTQLLRNFPERQAFFASGERLAMEEGLDSVLVTLLDSLAAFSGMVAENTTRGQDWFFLDLGRRIERGLILIDVVGDSLGVLHPLESIILARLLDFADSTMTYRRRYLTSVWPSAVFDLLLLDPSNPRSLAFQAERVADLSRRLPHHQALTRLHPLDRRALAMTTTVSLLEPSPLLEVDIEGRRPALLEFCRDISRQFTDFSDHLSAHYFAVTAVSPK